MDKQKRQMAIKQVIANQTITTQDELAHALRRHGFKITQATLSRDMKELGVAWVYTPTGSRYMLHTESEEHRLKSMIGLEVDSITSNEGLIVVKTLPGRAQGVAELIDGLHHPAILGTLAGDNTIFVAPKSQRKTADVLALIRKMMTTTQ